VALLRRAWKEGIDGGDAAEIDVAALKKEVRTRLYRTEAQRLSRVRFTAHAQGLARHLTFVYAARNTSEAVADRVLDSIEQSCCLLKEHPLLSACATRNPSGSTFHRDPALARSLSRH